MADKGFDIAYDVLVYGAKLNIPPFVKDHQQLSKKNVIITRKIASLRIQELLAVLSNIVFCPMLYHYHSYIPLIAYGEFVVHLVYFILPLSPILLSYQKKKLVKSLLAYCKRVVLFLINVHVTVLEFGLSCYMYVLHWNLVMF